MTTKRLTSLAMLIALSVIGANIHFLGSIALDSFPAFLGTLLFGPVSGIILGIVGHLFSAVLSGFPMTIPIHIFIAFMMGVTMAVYGYLQAHTSSRILRGVVAYLINVVVELIILIPILGWPVVAGLFVPLTLATIVNIILAEIVYHFLPDSFIKRLHN